MKPGAESVEAFVAFLARRGDTARHIQKARLLIEGFYAWWDEGGYAGETLCGPCLEAYRLWTAEQRGRKAGTRLSLSSQATRLGVMRNFCRFLVHEGVLAHNIAALLPRIKKPTPPRRVLSEAEMVRLCEAIGGAAPFAQRDRAFLEVLVATAMRPAEALALEVRDIDLATARVRIRRGKGQRLRWLPLTRSAIEALRAYLKGGRRALLPRGNPCSRLFFSRSPRGVSTAWDRLANFIVENAAKEAGIPGHIHPYTLRHSVATALARAGMELRQLQALLGHDSLSTTEVYLHLGPADLKDVHQRAHPRERDRREPRAKRGTLPPIGSGTKDRRRRRPASR